MTQYLYNHATLINIILGLISAHLLPQFRRAYTDNQQTFLSASQVVTGLNNPSRQCELLYFKYQKIGNELDNKTYGQIRSDLIGQCWN